MFGIGLGELAVIGLVAIVFLGPDKLPELARQAAHLVRWVRNLTVTARDQIRTELGPEYENLEIRDLDPRRFVTREISKAVKELDAADAAPAAPVSPDGAPLALGERPPYDDDAT